MNAVSVENNIVSGNPHGAIWLTCYSKTQPPEPESSPRPLLVVCSAMGTRQESYRQFATWCVTAGWDVVTFDYRGIGQSRDPRFPAASDLSLLDWATQDIPAILEWVKTHRNPRHIVALGHSIGGQLLGLSPDPNALDAIVLVSSQKGYWRFWPRPARYLMRFGWGLIATYARTLGELTLMRLAKCDPLPRQIALDWARWGTSPWFTDQSGRIVDTRFARYSGPLWAISIEDDWLYAPQKAVDHLTRLYQQCTPTCLRLAPRHFRLNALGHSGLFRAPECQQFWHELLGQIRHRVEPPVQPERRNHEYLN
ncbi:MAG: alpha/beta fold hydrolase [Marinobacter sp.]|nr:alpha/beta fold hydrolase [Marinobacter sp.]